MNAILKMLKGPIVALVLNLLQRYKRLSVEYLKIQGVICYVKGVQAVRQSVITLVLVMVLMSVLTAGFIILHAGLAIILYRYTGNIMTTGFVFAALGALYLIIAVSCILHFTSERTWMKLLKADELVAKVMKKTGK